MIEWLQNKRDSFSIDLQCVNNESFRNSHYVKIKWPVNRDQLSPDFQSNEIEDAVRFGQILPTFGQCLKFTQTLTRRVNFKDTVYREGRR